MTTYKDEVDTVPHDFNNSTLTIDGEFNVDGLEEWSVEMDEDEVTITSASDGTSVFNESPIKTGTITFSALEAPASTDKLWEKLESGDSFKIAFTDSAVPNLKVNAGRSRFVKRPTINRTRESEPVEWTIRCTYLNSKSGSYKVEA
jgi:hypothetical protein